MRDQEPIMERMLKDMLDIPESGDAAVNFLTINGCWTAWQRLYLQTFQ